MAKLNERGSVLTLFCVFAFVLLSFTALVIDVGTLFLQKAKMQAAADAAAMAGACKLRAGMRVAMDESKLLASLNGFTLSDTDVLVQGCRVTVSWKQPTMLLFGKSALVGCSASAESRGQAKVRPFGLPCPRPEDPQLIKGQIYTLKYNQSPASGNFMALSLDGSGSSVYRSAISSGAGQEIHFFDKIQTEPGNMKNPTDQALKDLFGTDHTTYENFIANPSQNCPRDVWVVLFDLEEALQGRTPLTVVDFARFFLLDPQNPGELRGLFIERLSETSSTAHLVR